MDEVVESFSRLAVAAGLTVDKEFHPEAFGSRLVRATRDSAELRLLWDGKEKYLSLEISHGPPTGEIAGWLELFRATCECDLVPAATEQSETIWEAVEYGIELMSFEPKGT